MSTTAWTATRTLGTALAGAVLAAVLGGCGDSRADVETAFRGYYTALLARDYPAACALTAPESTGKLLASLATQGVTAGTCEEALGAIFAEPGAADTADGIARSVQIKDVVVSGDRATVSWSASLEGAPRDATNGMRRIDGSWRLTSVGE